MAMMKEVLEGTETSSGERDREIERIAENLGSPTRENASPIRSKPVNGLA